MRRTVLLVVVVLIGCSGGAAPIDGAVDGRPPDGVTDAALDAAELDATIDAALDATTDAATDAADLDAPADAADLDAPLDAAVADAPADARVDATPVDAVTDARVDGPPVDAPIDAPPLLPGALRWLRTIADPPMSDNRAGVTALRAAGDHVYLTGAFWGTSTFGAGQSNQTTLTASAPEYNAFLARYDSAGTFAWVTKIGPLYSVITDAAVLPDGAVAIVGTFAWTCVDSWPGPGPNPSPVLCPTVFGAGGPAPITISVRGASIPRDNAFVAVFAPSGALRWVSWADASFSIFEGVTALPDGSVVAVGTIDGPADYRGATSTLTVGSGGDGGAVVVRFAPDGSPVWGAVEQGTCATRLTSIAASPDGTSLVVGGHVVSGTTPCTLQLAALGPTRAIGSGGRDHAVLGGFTAGGAPTWVLDLRGASSSAGHTRVWALATTTDGDVVAVGDLAHGCSGAACTMPFPSTDGSVLTVPQAGATFATRYGFDGTRRWARALGGVLRGAWTHALSATPDGGFVLTAQLYGTAEFGIGDPTPVLLDQQCVDSLGDSVWSRHAADGSLTRFARSICTIGEGAGASATADYWGGRYYNHSIFAPGTPGQITVNAGPPPTNDEDLAIMSLAP